MPFADPEKEKAKKRRWWKKKMEADAAFKKAQKASQLAWSKTPRGKKLRQLRKYRAKERANPQKDYRRFNLDDAKECREYLDYLSALKSAGIRKLAQMNGCIATVSVLKRSLAKLEGSVGKE